MALAGRGRLKQMAGVVLPRVSDAPDLNLTQRARTCMYGAIAAYAVILLLLSLAVDTTWVLLAVCLAGACVIAGLANLLAASGVSKPMVNTLVAPQQDAPLSQPTNAVAPDVPEAAALPFMGERILLDIGSEERIAKLKDAAAKLGRRPTVRNHPWSELMARVSHELRTPLNAVIGFTDMMSTEVYGPLGDPRYRDYLNHIRDGGRDLLKSAEDTLAMTALIEGNTLLDDRKAHELGSMVRECWGFYADVSGARGVMLHEDIPAGLELVMERRVLRQILINLFAEALNRVEDGGAIVLAVNQDSDLVQVEVFVRGDPTLAQMMEPSLAVCLARALLELQGAALVEVSDPACAWRALTVLRGAAQDDFFAAAEAVEPVHVAHMN